MAYKTESVLNCCTVVTYSAHCLQDYSIPVNAVYCNIPVNMMMMNLAVMRSEKGCVFWCI